MGTESTWDSNHRCRGGQSWYACWDAYYEQPCKGIWDTYRDVHPYAFECAGAYHASKDKYSNKLWKGKHGLPSTSPPSSSFAFVSNLLGQTRKKYTPLHAWPPRFEINVQIKQKAKRKRRCQNVCIYACVNQIKDVIRYIFVQIDK